MGLIDEAMDADDLSEFYTDQDPSRYSAITTESVRSLEPESQHRKTPSFQDWEYVKSRL